MSARPQSRLSTTRFEPASEAELIAAVPLDERYTVHASDGRQLLRCGKMEVATRELRTNPVAKLVCYCGQTIAATPAEGTVAHV